MAFGTGGQGGLMAVGVMTIQVGTILSGTIVFNSAVGGSGGSGGSGSTAGSSDPLGLGRFGGVEVAHIPCGVSFGNTMKSK